MANKFWKGSCLPHSSSPLFLRLLLGWAVILSCPLLLFAQRQYPAWFANLPESGSGRVLVVGYVGRYTKPERAREAAIQNAIRNLAQYFQMRLKFDLLELSDGRLMVTHPVFEKGFNTGLIEQFQDNISVLDSLPTEEGYFVLVAYPKSAKKGDYHEVREEWNKTPDWIQELPRQTGYVFGLGQVARYTHWVRAWRDADDYARFDLAKSLKLSTESISAEQRENRMVKSSVIRRQTIDFLLLKANIVARWYDPQSDTYYSLCRAPKQ